MKKTELYNMIKELEDRIKVLEADLISLKILKSTQPNIIGTKCLICGQHHPIGVMCPNYYFHSTCETYSE